MKYLRICVTKIGRDLFTKNSETLLREVKGAYVSGSTSALMDVKTRHCYDINATYGDHRFRASPITWFWATGFPHAKARSQRSHIRINSTQINNLCIRANVIKPQEKNIDKSSGPWIWQ